MSGARTRRVFDVERLAESLERPEWTTPWISMARVDEEPDAVRWDQDHGWVVDVTFFGGELDQEGEIPCRVLSPGLGCDGYGEFSPPDLSCEVAVAQPDGLDSPVILGSACNADGGRPPDSVNGLPISGEAAVSTAATVSPYDTEFRRSPHNRREHYDGDHWDQAANQVLEAAELVRLATRNAGQSFVRGERFVEVLGVWMQAVTDFVQANATADAAVYAAVNGLAPGSIPPTNITEVATAAGTVPAAREAFDAAAVEGDALSARIKGD